ncbi:MAG: serine/threonine protein kinase [Gemmataceae bacterium]|nr:serine/threonine protein kinase [Gemmataceae bacterium]
MLKDESTPATLPSSETSPDNSRPRTRGIAVGDLLGRCLLTEALGRGGSCLVFRALHQPLNIPVAVKVLQLGAGVAHWRDYEQLRSEARLLAQLAHPHIVRILDFEDDPVSPYLVLECVEGPSLNDLIQQSGRLSLERACQVVMQVADALGALWQIGAVHRDVKPGNILLTRDGSAKLADFGQAVFVEEQEIAADEAAPRDELSGTAAYLAPEQFLAPSSVDHRSDIYALGGTFYHAVTGQLPFSGRSRMEVMRKHATELPPPAHELVPELGTRVSDVIRTMMARHADDRYQNLEEVHRALESLSAVGDEVALPDATPLPQPAARRRRSFWNTLIPPLTPTAAAPANDEWLEVVKRSLNAAARKKG